jgi:hypothetical protein
VPFRLPARGREICESLLFDSESRSHRDDQQPSQLELRDVGLTNDSECLAVNKRRSSITGIGTFPARAAFPVAHKHCRTDGGCNC